jgi:hypothetical protein
MPADLEYECRQLAREMETRLRGGIFLNRDTRQFMASTFSIERPQELRDLLADPDDSEAQSLLELLFTPGESMRVDLEEIIEKSSCTDKDEQAIINHLFQKKIAVPFQFPGAGDTLTCRPAKHLLETWVRSLKITTRLPAELVATVDTNTRSRMKAQIKAALRCTRVGLTGSVCRFLCRLLEKAPAAGSPLLEDLELCLAVLDEQPETSSPFDLFMTKKQRLLEMLQQAKRFEKQLAGNNIETLILKGVRAPHIDQADTRDKIDRIDAICLAVFGVTDSLLKTPTDVDLGDFTDRSDLDRAFEILS